MRRAVLVLATLAALLPGIAAAQGASPEESGLNVRRVAVSRDADFYGSDLATLFDVTLDACQAACLADQACRAFTYNRARAACFPKSGVAEVRPFPGAVSGRVLDTDPAALAAAPARAEALGLEPWDLSDAAALGQDIGREHSSDEAAASDLLASARAREGEGDRLSALRFTGAALALTDAPAQWRDYARLALTLEPDTGETEAARSRARPAALAAYLRDPDPAGQAQALLLLAEALESEDRGRDALKVLRLAVSLDPTDDTRSALDRAAGLFGLTVADTQVDSDAALPRVCVNFSEALRPGLDYSPYVRLPDPALTVTAQDAQLCVEGAAHGQRIALTLREGLPAASGETLAADVDLSLYVRDRTPSAQVLSRATVLPRGGDATIPVSSVNVDAVALTLARLSDANLLRSLTDGSFDAPQWGWDRERFSRDLGEVFWEGTVSVRQGAPNADTITEVPLGDVLAGRPAGVYVLTAAVPGQNPDDVAATSQWFVLSDLGLATWAGTDGLTVAVRSLADASAVAGVTVRLASRANAILGEAVTDERGVATFPAGLVRGTGGQAPALVTALAGDPQAPSDLAFLSLMDPAFDLSDRGVEGRPAPGPIDAYLVTERGAYRAGETVHATALLRDDGARAVEAPLTAILTRPDGVEAARVQSAAGDLGGHVFALPIAAGAPRGTWTLAVAVDPEADEPLAETRFLVEDFLPERVDVALTPGAKAAVPGASLAVDLQADWLFGAPAAGLALEGEVTLAPVAEVPGWAGWSFGLADGAPAAQAESFSGDVTDAAGAARLSLPVPLLDLPADRPLEARVAVRAVESSGRPVERRLTVPVALDGPVLGIKAPDGLPEGGVAAIPVVALGPDLRPVALPVHWTLNRIETRYQWYEVYGDWSWEPQTRRVRIAEGDLALGAAPGTVEAPVEWGRYELVLEGGGGGASATFTAGWFAPEAGEESPDRLAVALDAASYAPGDTAHLRIDAEGPGVALVTVLTSRVVALVPVEVGADGATVDLPVTDEWGAGAYVAAEMIRPLDGRAAGQAREPVRSLGLAHAAVAPGDRALAVTVTAPDTMRPRGPLPVEVAVEGLAPNEAAYVTLAAVDVGILNLTAHPSPDPQAWFLGQRRLGVEMRDLYGRLILPAGGDTGTLREGGDAMALAPLAPPPTEDLVAFFDGPVEVGPDGRATASFAIPAFDGTVRVMAMAWSAKGVGADAAEVLVRDPAVLTASLPRHLAPGDTSRLRLDLTHADGPAGAFDLSVSAPGLGVDETLAADLDPLGTWRRDLTLTAGAPGTEAVGVTIATPGGETLERAYRVPVEALDPAVARTLRLALAPGETFTFDDAVLAGFVPGSAEATLSVGPLARLDAPGLLVQLDRVPWGCTEQVTSQALPLLYLAEVARAVGAVPASGVEARLDDAVAAVLANQDSSGGFGLWGPWAGDPWLDAYVTDFLGRARAHGIAVPDTAWRMALDNLRNQVAISPDFEPEVNGGGEALAYALLVLAREGEALVGDLRYFADEKADEFGTPLALAQLGAALAQTGDPARADRLFGLAGSRLAAAGAEPLQSVWRADYGTLRRDTAGVLALAVESGSRAVDASALTAALAADGAEPASTQEAAWTLLAAAALAGDVRAAGITVDGQVPDGPVIRRVDGTGAAPVAVANDGAAPVDLTVTALGVPASPEPAGGTGWAIERAWYAMDGTPADPSTVAAGTRLVVVLTVRPLGYQAARLMVTDPLPGGFEIDNPNLLEGGDTAALGWLDPVAPAHAEARSDRFLAAVDWQSADPFQVAYVARAVTPGDYAAPAPSVEDMYRPAMRAQGEAGRVTVTE